MMILKVFLYHFNCHKWAILFYFSFALEVVEFCVAMISEDPAAHLTPMTLSTLTAVAVGLKVKYDNREKNRNRHR